MFRHEKQARIFFKKVQLIHLRIQKFVQSNILWFSLHTGHCRTFSVACNTLRLDSFPFIPCTMHIKFATSHNHSLKCCIVGYGFILAAILAHSNFLLMGSFEISSSISVGLAKCCSAFTDFKYTDKFRTFVENYNNLVRLFSLMNGSSLTLFN